MILTPLRDTRLSVVLTLRREKKHLEIIYIELLLKWEKPGYCLGGALNLTRIKTRKIASASNTNYVIDYY